MTHSHVEWECLAVECNVRVLLIFVLALPYSSNSSTAHTQAKLRIRKPQLPGLYRNHQGNRSTTWRLTWSCTTRCLSTTLHARISSPFHKIRKCLWRYVLHLKYITSHARIHVWCKWKLLAENCNHLPPSEALAFPDLISSWALCSVRALWLFQAKKLIISFTSCFYYITVLHVIWLKISVSLQ